MINFLHSVEMGHCECLERFSASKHPCMSELNRIAVRMKRMLVKIRSRLDRIVKRIEMVCRQDITSQIYSDAVIRRVCATDKLQRSRRISQREWNCLSQLHLLVRCVHPFRPLEPVPNTQTDLIA